MSTVFDYLIREPVEALLLSSAALFLRTDDGSFQRIRAHGWNEATTSVIEHDDALALELATDCEPLRVADIGWHRSELPTGDATPVLAVPIAARRELLGIVLYSAHRNGADIDPEEIRALGHLARAAQATYDHLRALELEQQVAVLRAEVATLQAKTGELAG